jgi:hypothetical protein
VAPPPGRRAIQPVLREGDLLAGRYRLERRLTDDDTGPDRDDDADLTSDTTTGTGAESPAVVWRAFDQVLARPVAVTLLRAAGKRAAAAARPFLEAAARAGAVTAPGLARVYDAAIESLPAERAGRPVGEVDVAYVIREWVDGRDLATVLREDGPFEPASAVALASDAADALHVAHERGVTHGRLHPGNVLLTPSGRLVLTDTATASALPGRAVPAGRADDPVGPAADVRDLTAVLYAMLTARWPTSATPQPAAGVPPAPALSDGRARRRLTRPAQVRAGIPRTLDDLVVRVLQPAPGRPAPHTAAALADALSGALRIEVPRPRTPRRPPVPPWLRRHLPLLAGISFLLVVALVGYVTGRELGEVPALDEEFEAIVSPPPRGAPGRPVDLATARVVDFDPPPGDGRERPETVPNAFDDDLTTRWRTDRYATAAFGGIKQGVGLLIDLGAPTDVVRVELAAGAEGARFELRAGDDLGASADDFRVVASGTAGGEPVLTLVPADDTTARWYLVWVTALAPVDGGFAAHVAEMRFVRR